MDDQTLREACEAALNYIGRRTRTANVSNATLRRMCRDIPDMEQWQLVLQLREALEIPD